VQVLSSHAGVFAEVHRCGRERVSELDALVKRLRDLSYLRSSRWYAGESSSSGASALEYERMGCRTSDRLVAADD